MASGTSKFFLSIGFLILFAMVAGTLTLWLSTERGIWRYKMTVAVETPEGIRTGSAIREVSISKSTLGEGFPEATTPVKFRGEAVAVDLGERGVVFALIDWNSYSDVYTVFPFHAAPHSVEGIKYYDSLPAGKKGELPLKYGPKMVTFTDLSDPKSVELVYAPRRGKSPINKFEEVFGEGVALQSITIEMTNEPVTWGRVEEFLPAFGEDYWKWIKKLNYGDPRLIGRTNFKRKE